MQDILATARQIGAALTAPDGPMPLEEIEVAGRRMRVFVNAPLTINQILDDMLANHADKDMLDNEGERWSYARVFEAAARLANVLRDDHGIRPGDRIGIAMRNRPEWFIGFIAAQRLGAIPALLNSRGAPDELAAAIDKVECRLVLADRRRAERVASASRVETPDLKQLMARAAEASADFEPVAVSPDSPGMILFTSGTTGRAKGATLSHRNIGNMAMVSSYTGALNLTLRARQLGVDPQELRAKAPPMSQLLVVPLFHISGIVTFLLSGAAGGLMTLMRRWNADKALDIIEANRVTALTGPTMMMADLLAADRAAERLQGVGSMVIGGQASPIGLTNQIRQMVPRASQSSGWGMTEVCGSATSASGLIFEAYPGSVGINQPVFDLRIMREDGQQAGPGEIGEIQLRGSMVMMGYWNDEQATRDAFDDGWYRTGDLGYLSDEGILYIADRAKDMVISAGENIYCAEIERVLSSTPHFLEVAMFGVPDERLGERAVAAVTLRPGVDLSEGEVQAIARQHLADYKVPAEVIFDLGPFPRNASGKIDKAALRNKYLKEREPA